MQRAIQFLSSPAVRGQPDAHAAFLESKGVTAAEVREALTRLGEATAPQAEGAPVDDAAEPINTSLPNATYDEFVGRLVHAADPDAAALRDSLASFIEMFRTALGTAYDVADRSALVQHQVEQTAQHVLAYYNKVHRPVSAQIVMECVEKYLLSRLHALLFQPDNADAELYHRMRRLRWVRIEHLDIAPHLCDDTLWSVAQQEMLNINLHKAPRDKMLCIVKACKILYSALEMLSGDGAVSADALLPVLIYNILRANPPDLCCNIAYVEQYRHPMHMRHEASYFFVSFCTAVAFIQQLSASSLSINVGDYQRYMNEPDGDRNGRMAAWQQGTSHDPNLLLLHSCAGGDLSMVEQLVEQGASTNYVHPDSAAGGALLAGDFPLSVAARFANTEVVRYLLANGADVGLRNSEGRTVLHLECIGHMVGRRRVYNLEAIQLLVRGGADIDALDQHGRTPVDYAREAPDGVPVLRLLHAIGNDRTITASEAVEAERTVPELVRQHSTGVGVETMWGTPLLVAHKMQEGETMGQISARFGVPESTILRLNRISSSPPSRLFIPIARRFEPHEELRHKNEILSRMRSVV